jgi:hypothetical protein
VIEQSFGMLKMKWQILLKQSKIIVACMALHNVIRDHDLDDSDFQLDVQDDSDPTSQPSYDEGTISSDETDMSALCDVIAAAMVV